MHIQVIHVTESDDTEAMASKLEKIKDGYGKRFQSTMSMSFSKESLTASILEAQKAHKADLIIMGTSGSTDEDKATNTSGLVLEADCPVLVVPEAPEEFRVKHIALVLGKDEIDDTRVLATLLDVSRRFNAKVHVLTIENEPGTYGYSEADNKNEDMLEYYLEDFYADHMFIENPDVVEGISTYAEDKEIDIIAILPRNHTRHSNPSKGRLTRILALQSKIPLLAID